MASNAEDDDDDGADDDDDDNDDDDDGVYDGVDRRAFDTILKLCCSKQRKKKGGVERLGIGIKTLGYDQSKTKREQRLGS
jgi:hypothetical protein